MNKKLHCSLAGLLLLPALAMAQAWPSKTVRVLHGFSPGAATQVLAQEVGETLAKSANATSYVEARPGAGGNMGSDAVAKSAPDGYSLLVGTSGTHAVNPSLYRNLPFNVQKDFEPITLLADMPNVLLVNKTSPFNSVADLVAYAKAHPGELNYGSSGNGTSMHLAAEQFKFASGGDILHVPFKESAHALVALMGGQIQLTFHQLPAVLQQIRSGTVKALAVTGRQRAAVLPDVPTVAESGYPSFESTTWYGLFAPAKTPPALVARINGYVTGALKSSMGERLASLGMSPHPSTPAELAQTIVADTARWKSVIDRVGVRIE